MKSEGKVCTDVNTAFDNEETSAHDFGWRAECGCGGGDWEGGWGGEGGGGHKAVRAHESSQRT
jgi:hypothetical protein